MTQPPLLDPADWPWSLAPLREQMESPSNLDRLLANRPELLAAWWPFRDFVVHGTELSERSREIVILRVARKTDCDYLWHRHGALAAEAGVSATEVSGIGEDPLSGDWPAAERCLLSAVDQCISDHGLSAENREVLARHHGPRGAFDLIATVGMSLTLAQLAKSFEVPSEEAAPSDSEDRPV